MMFSPRRRLPILRSLLFCLIGILFCLPAGQAHSQAISVPAGDNIYSYLPATTWTLEGNAYFYNPAGTLASTAVAGTTITGASGGSTITLNDGTAIPASFGALSLTAGTLTVGNVTFTGGGQHVISSSGNVVLNTTGDLSFINNTAGTGGSGGVIYNPGGSITIGGSSGPYAITFANNEADGNGGSTNGGGAIDSFGDVVIGSASATSVSFTNNHSLTASGAILAVAGGGTQGSVTITADQVTLDGNYSYTFGAIGSWGSTVTINGNQIAVTNNYATGPVGGNGSTGVGAIMGEAGVTLGNAGSTVTVNGNHSVYQGGAIQTTNGPITINGVAITVDGNYVTGTGQGLGALGAFGSLGIMTLGNADGTTNAVTVDGNYAGFDGAIYTQSAPVAIYGKQIAVTNNEATASTGGAIRSGGDLLIGYAGSTVTVDHNSAATSYGAIYSVGSTTINGDQIAVTNNKAGAGQTGAIQSGGAVTIGNTDGSTSQVTIANNNAATTVGAIFSGGSTTINGGSVEVTSNSAPGYGAIYSSAAVIIGGNTISVTDNKATSAQMGAIAAMGGNVVIGNADGTTGTVTLADNSAATGVGAAYSAQSVIVHGGAISVTDNSGGTGPAGAIYAGAAASIGDAGTGTITIANNNAGTSAGAVYAAGDITLTAGTSSITNNVATAGSGGGLDSGTGNVAVNGALTADKNMAGLNGGAIYAAAGGVTIGNGLTLTNNQAQGGNGGGIYADGSVIALGPMTITNNQATGNGGAIYMGVDGADLTLSPTGATVISSNIAGGNGGALYSNGNVTINAGAPVTFSNNQAGGLGGAIYVDPDVVTLNAVGGDITFTGNMMNTAGTPQANAIYIDDLDAAGGADTPVQLNLNANGANIIFYDPIANNQASGPIIVTKDGPGMVSFDGTKFGPADYTNLTSAVYANTTVNAGTFEVANHAIYGAYYDSTGAYTPGSDPVAGTPVAGTSFTSASGTMVQGGIAGTIVADAVNINGNMSIAGRQLWSTAGQYSTFTINANTAKFSGGTVYFNTMLNEGMPNSNSDLLILNHAQTTGAAFLSVANTNGLGAYTPGDGIMLVQSINGATTQPGMFALSGPVAAGAYEYNLFQGGVAGDPTAANNWYLRNTLQVGPPVVIPPTSPGGPSGPSAPIIIPGPTLPNYRVEVPVYMAAPALANRMGLMMLGTYHERVGEDRPNDWDTDELQVVLPDGKGEPRTKSGWGRVFGQIGNVGFNKSGNNFASNGPSFDYSMGAIQVGGDLLRGQHDNGQRDIAGLYVGMMTSHADVKRVYSGGSAGTVDMNGYSLAAYWTRKGVKEWYLDAVLQGTRYANSEAKSDRGQKIHPDGWGLTASLEAGYPIRLGHHGWALEPQGQIIYQWISLNSDSDAFGRVKFDDQHAWVGRIGARLTKDWTSDTGKKASVWARANLWHTFDSTAKTTFTSTLGMFPTGLKTRLGGTWGQVGLGVDGHLTPRLTAFVNGDYNFNLGSQNGHSLGGRVGLRYEFK